MGLGDLEEKQIKRLGAALARHTGQEKEEAEKTRNLFQRLVLLRAKDNAAQNIPELIILSLQTTFLGVRVRA